ncbi:MAG: DNA alkylation repair protein [Clostridia bacterium]|nr:DNA alkylation repair protein [Clostridia bacterium]
MELSKQHWTIEDGKDFQKFLIGCGNTEKAEWATRILSTAMPVLAIPTPKINEIVKQIASGNFLELLNLNLWQYYENSAVNGSLIMKIKDFDLMVKYLLSYSEKVDNWASCDLLDFKMINETNKEKFFALSKKFVKADKPFTRRIGLRILFKFIDDSLYLPQIFEILNGFEAETHYYVNMINAWLVAECFTKAPEKTLEFLQTHKLNRFTINKAVQKCRDSFRVSAEDKEMLLKFKK